MGAVAVAVSQDSTVRMFDGGELVAETVPEPWLLDRYGSQAEGRVAGRTVEVVGPTGRGEPGGAPETPGSAASRLVDRAKGENVP